jgi:hypothetical protein
MATKKKKEHYWKNERLQELATKLPESREQLILELGSMVDGYIRRTEFLVDRGSTDDLRQAYWIAVINAVDTYKPDRGALLSTWALSYLNWAYIAFYKQEFKGPIGRAKAYRDLDIADCGSSLIAPNTTEADIDHIDGVNVVTTLMAKLNNSLNNSSSLVERSIILFLLSLTEEQIDEVDGSLEKLRRLGGFKRADWTELLKKLEQYNN